MAPRFLHRGQSFHDTGALRLCWSHIQCGHWRLSAQTTLITWCGFRFFKNNCFCLGQKNIFKKRYCNKLKL
ncbi:hypothetical protein XENTR_v10006536 [Xenopus tropicalis]|nr:hypothetical protein XENTR_v10006536 [Xenopus tropicalis]